MNLDLATVSTAVKAMPIKKPVQARNDSSFKQELGANTRADKNANQERIKSKQSASRKAIEKSDKHSEPVENYQATGKSERQHIQRKRTEAEPLSRHALKAKDPKPAKGEKVLENTAAMLESQHQLDPLDPKMQKILDMQPVSDQMSSIESAQPALTENLSAPSATVSAKGALSQLSATGINPVPTYSADQQEVENHTSQLDKLAILKFMDSIESEVGIPREKFAQAMVNVSSQKPGEPAADTVDEVISQLNLPPQQEARVRQQYQQLVGEIEAEEEGSSQSQSAGVIQRAPTDDGTEKVEGKRKTAAMATFRGQRLHSPKLNLDKVNGRFFLREGLESGQFKRPGMLEQQVPLSVDEEFANFKTPGRQERALVSEQVIPFQQPVDVELPQMEQTKQGLMAYGQNSNADGGDSVELGTSFTSMSDHSDSHEQSSDQQMGEQTTQPSLVQQNRSQQQQIITKPFTMQSLTAQPTVDSADTNQFVSHANMLAKQGGGEMRMILQPEGLGQVDLKVQVKNGNVQIEMLADTAEARQLLEKSVGDLRNGLSSQNLVVDEIKVELAEDASRNQFEEKQNDADQQMSRDMARGFLENFRNSSGFHREEIMGVAGLRTYGQARGKTPDVKPIGEAEANVVEKERGKGRNLNLVA